MQASKIPTDLFTGLDIASQGKLREIWQACDAKGWELDVSCVTYLNGLPDKDMKLYVTATNDGCTEFFASAPLEGEARRLGWNLYISEKMQDIREGVRRAVEKIDAVDQLA